ncbi:MAG: hypothetical protein KBG28_07970 [Kofleriaceae bacterium]|nr:hypothetical protein [Kofleriaceae bacterium]MBP6835882.1 hypothetical protein [Kofleriaceae bacterium]MBP9203881.1 hypothetical protein [Kofleriaceae bacterium]
MTRTRTLTLAAVLLGAVAGLTVVAAPAPAWAQAEDDLREGDRHFEEGEWKRAAAAYDGAIRRYPTQVPAEAYGKRAAIYIILEDYAGGLAFIRDVAKAQHPGAAEVLEQEALLLWQTGKKADAVAVAEQAVAKKASTFTNQQLVGEYYAGRDARKTATAYEAYLQHRPADLEAGDVLPRIRLGFAYLGLARIAADGGAALYEKAVTQFETVQRKHGKRPHAQVNADNGLCAALAGLGRHDQAITVCERVVGDPRRVDKSGSVWFNLASALLAKRQIARARTAGNEFLRLRKGEARGHILLGDTYYLERNWQGALDQYSRAEAMLRPGQQREQIQLSIRLGKTYRRLPGGAANLALAVQKLEAGAAANPKSVELAVELGGAYLASRQDAKAQLMAERIATDAGFAAQPAADRAAIRVLAGKAHYNQGKLREARAQFEAAVELRGNDVQIKRALIDTINKQASASALGKDGGKAAHALLDQALALDPGSATTLTNQVVLAIDRGECELAQRHVGPLLAAQGADPLLARRLAGRVALCGKAADPRRAGELFAEAEREGKKGAGGAVLAEVYIEWAPLLARTDLDGAAARLTDAAQLAGAAPELAPALRRNTALVLFQRGWKLMREGKGDAAAADLTRAARDASVLRGTEPEAFEFSRGLALLEKGDAGDASRVFRQLAGRGNPADYLRPAYAKVGLAFFTAYANYRGGTLATRTSAAGELAKALPNVSGPLLGKTREILASAWELIGAEHWREGKPGLAQKALENAAKYADGDAKRRISHDRAVTILGKGQLSTFEGFAGNPPEALINLGILYDQLGRPRDAYEAWVKAKAKGASARDLQKWIDTKKRIYGF